jgi:hypothetical protein
MGNRSDPWPLAGITGMTIADGWAASCKIVYVAGTVAVLCPNGSPVFGLGANCGKSLLEISNRIRSPARTR